MRKILLITFILLIIFSVPFLFAQQKIPYVDINEAETKISELEAENEQLTEQSQTLQEENNTLETDIQDWQRQISEIGAILERVKQKGADLYELYSDIVDKETKDKAQETIERNREIRDKLKDEKETLEKQVASAQGKMAKNKKQVQINNNKTARNIDTINLLTASIEKTRNQTGVLNNYIETVEEINEEASKFLGETATSE